ncbi:MAG: hypothetical protein JSS87_14200 [Acidobacteria bacterium]|nr:hypothetical protein [Acidobacteriota bacterium]
MAENEIEPSIDEQEIPDTPEDVAILYSWANMHGAKYRDFSASRREYRAQMRARAMEAQREAELKAAQEREEAARREEEAARRAAVESSSSRRAALELEEAGMRAEMERMEAQRHAHAAELARQAAIEAEREAEEARRRAKEQALRYAESEQRRAFAGPQTGEVPGTMEDPYHYTGHVDPARLANSGIRASGFRSPIGRSYSSSSLKNVAEYRPDLLPDSDHLLRNEASQGTGSDRVLPYEMTAGDRRERRTEEERQGSGYHVARREPRAESRLFRPPASSLVPSSIFHPLSQSRGAQSAHERRKAPDDPNFVFPPHKDRREPANLYNRTGQHGHGNLEDDTRRADEFQPAHRGERPQGPSAETEPRRAYEDQSGKRSREDAEARHSLHERVTRELNQDRYEEEMARDTEARLRHERRQREVARLRAEQNAREEALAEEQRLTAAEKGRSLADMEEKHYAQQERESAPGKAGLPSSEEWNEGLHMTQREEQRRSDEERMRREREDRDEAARSREHRKREEARREAERRERARIDLRESMMSSGYRSAANVSGITPTANVYAAEGASSRPAWLHGEAPLHPQQAGAMHDTLQQSRERVAARWFALKELMGQSSGEHAKAEVATQSQQEVRTPSLCVISMAGGVGKTSMVATLGRTLSAMGEKVLLADTGSHGGLLPYYFGARDLRPGVVRTFSPPAGSPDAPVYMVNYDTDAANYDVGAQDHIYDELKHASRGIHRVLLDLNMHSAWMVRRLAKYSPAILVPLGPDMNSVLGIQSIERILSGLTNAEGHILQPYYVLNQFDATLPLHLDVREVLRQKLGDRLLPIVVRRAPAVAEALAEGMTVMDYAPNSSVTEDYTQLATWVRNLTAPAPATFRGMRWSEG